ncbi:hypothetical protein T484DRAFT_1845487 [Baffinella frigidus]|nr:hypothetical protein T484DRAFT_1845487 [Cryptophyta sp. CCMP2293]
MEMRFSITPAASEAGASEDSEAGLSAGNSEVCLNNSEAGLDNSVGSEIPAGLNRSEAGLRDAEEVADFVALEERVEEEESELVCLRRENEELRARLEKAEEALAGQARSGGRINTEHAGRVDDTQHDDTAASANQCFRMEVILEQLRSDLLIHGCIPALPASAKRLRRAAERASLSSPASRRLSGVRPSVTSALTKAAPDKVLTATKAQELERQLSHMCESAEQLRADVQSSGGSDAAIEAGAGAAMLTMEKEVDDLHAEVEMLRADLLEAARKAAKDAKTLDQGGVEAARKAAKDAKTLDQAH